MNKEESLSLFSRAEIYPKFIQISPYHQIVSLGLCEEKDHITNDDEYLIHLHPFFSMGSSLWDGFCQKSYKPSLLIKDGKEYCYQKVEWNEETFPVHPWEMKLLPSAQDYFQWEEMIHSFQNSNLEKVVAGKVEKGEIIQTSSLYSLLSPLLHLPGALFAFSPRKGSIFFGLSPEHLFRRENETLYTEAVAGTWLKGKLNRETILASKKENEEFQFVDDYIQFHLERLCSEVHSSPLQIKETPTLQHLHKTYFGQLEKNITDHDILDILHPTPALCGTPKKEALEWLLSHENFERGYYGAPIGWRGKNSSEFVVGIRSCLIQDSLVYFFSAAGITKSSKPLLEWRELEYKTQLMKSLFHEKHTLLESSLSS